MSKDMKYATRVMAQIVCAIHRHYEDTMMKDPTYGKMPLGDFCYLVQDHVKSLGLFSDNHQVVADAIASEITKLDKSNAIWWIKDGGLPSDKTLTALKWWKTNWGGDWITEYETAF